MKNQQGTAHRPSQAGQEYVLNSKGEKVKNTAFRGGIIKNHNNILLKDIGLTAQQDFSSDVLSVSESEKIFSQGRQISNVKEVTDLCEFSLTDDADNSLVAESIHKIDNKKRPISLRNLNKEEIEEVLENWRDSLFEILEDKTGSSDIPEIRTNNAHGSSAASDIIAIYPDGTIYPIEVKFGAMTNSNSGIKRIGTILGEQAFRIENKEELFKEYYKRGQDTEWLQDQITQRMKNYAEEFNKRPHIINSQELYDMLHSSGASGNSQSEGNENYTIITFGTKSKKATAQEITIDITPDDEWDVRVVASIIDTDKNKSTRLNYIFVNKNDPRKTVRATFNNKQSVYIDTEGNKINKKKINNINQKIATGEILKIPSRFFLGGGGYNVWFYDKSKKEKILDE